MIHRAHTVGLVFAVLTVTVLSKTRVAAAAEPPVSSPAAPSKAYALFRQGRALLETQDYDLAAAKFEESFRLDPGGGTKLNLALAYELAGKTASAWYAFGDALRMALGDRREDRVAEAEAHIRRLEPRLSTLRIVIPEALSVPGLRVRLDGIELESASWNHADPVDPGDHIAEATAPGKIPWLARTTVAAEGDRRELTVALKEPMVQPSPVGEKTAGHPQHRAAAYSLLASAALLAGTGVVAWRVHEDSLAIYNDDGRCLVETATRGEQCGGRRTTANIALGVELGAFAAAAAAAIVGGWLLWAPEPSPPRSARTRCAPLATFPTLAWSCWGRF